MKQNKPADTRISVVAQGDVNDHTGFDQGDWNGWLRGSAGAEATITHLPETNEYFLYGNRWERKEGEIISKELSGLVVGETYHITYRGKKSEVLFGNTANNPRVAVHVAGQEVISPKVFARVNVWSGYTGTFVAQASSEKIEFLSVMKNASGEELPNEGYGNLHIDDIHVYDKYRDLTDFNDSTTGRWTPGPVAASATFPDEGGEHRVVWKFYTPGGNTHAGIIAHRTFDALIPGRTYRFSIDARMDTNINQPRLSLEISGMPQGETILPVLSWRTFSRTFVASDYVELSVISQRADSNGNDYSLDNILIVEEDA